MPGATPDMQIWSSYVKAFESYRLTWQTDRHDRNCEARRFAGAQRIKRVNTSWFDLIFVTQRLHDHYYYYHTIWYAKWSEASSCSLFFSRVRAHDWHQKRETGRVCGLPAGRHTSAELNARALAAGYSSQDVSAALEHASTEVGSRVCLSWM